MRYITGGKRSDISKGAVRQYPKEGPLPVYWSIQTWKGIVGGASHYYLIFETAENPYICFCDGEQHYHRPWGGGGPEELHRFTYTDFWKAVHALRKLVKYYRKNKPQYVVKSKRSRYR